MKLLQVISFYIFTWPFPDIAMKREKNDLFLGMGSICKSPSFKDDLSILNIHNFKRVCASAVKLWQRIAIALYRKCDAHTFSPRFRTRSVCKDCGLQFKNKQKNNMHWKVVMFQPKCMQIFIAFLSLYTRMLFIGVCRF